MPQDHDESFDSQTDDVSVEQETEEIAHSNGTSNRIAALEQNAQVQQLLMDPEIHAVLQARRQGKKVKIVEDSEESQANEAEEPDLTEGLPEGDPARETLSKVTKLINTKLSSKDRQIAEMAQKIQQLEGVATKVQERDIESQITQVQTKYKDFKTFSKPMVELSKQHPGLSVEDLYVLAKSRSGKLKMVEQGTFTERPTTQPSRSPVAARRNPTPQPPAPGRKGFEEIMARALKNAELGED